MAFPKALTMMMMIIIIIASLVTLSVVYAAQVADTLFVPQPQIDSNTVARSLLQNNDIDCKSACDARCAETKRRNLCKRACGTCCERCHCVPPGTSGNEDVCPCYANMTTHGGRHKCP